MFVLSLSVLLALSLTSVNANAQWEKVSLTASNTKLTVIKLPASGLNSSESVRVLTRFADGQTNPEETRFTLVNDDHSASWVLDPTSRSNSHLLCFKSEPDYDTVDLVANSQSDVEFEYKLEKETLALQFDEPKLATVSAGSPVTFLIDPVSAEDASLNDRYVLNVESATEKHDDVCMFVTAYGKSCPYLNTPRNVENSDMWFTALSKGSMTIRYEQFDFNQPFFVSVMIPVTDDQCHLKEDESWSTQMPRTKNVTVSITKAIKYKQYITPVGVSLLITILIIAFSFVIMSTKRLEKEQDVEEDSVYYSPEGSKEAIDMRAAKKAKRTRDVSGDVVDTGIANDENNGNNPRSIDPMINTQVQQLRDQLIAVIPEDSTRRKRIELGLQRLNPEAKLTDMSQILKEDVWFRRNRSRVYCYLVPLLSLFYFIPAIQFVFLVKESESLTGSQDLCFHNFECSNPLNLFADFNHVISNLSYFFYGLAFMGIVRFKAQILPRQQNPKNDHKSETGIIQQLSIFYAMGFALSAQGFFSVCYHVCPTNHSLQFDSTMMYIICMLGIVKIYQLRHPDANANAYSFFYFLGGIVLVEALALYSDSWWIYGLFIVFYMAMTVFIATDCYFMGVGRLDGKIAKEMVKNLVSKKSLSKPKYPKRFGFAFIFVMLNFAHAVFITVNKLFSPRRTVTHVVLLILAGNLFLYILYYVYRKNLPRFRNFYNACRSKDDIDARYAVHVMGKEIPCCISAGSLFAVSAAISGGFAANFYLSRNANRNLSPAESRELNEPCMYFNFFDNHDMWHFTSATAIFMAFLALLTLDDDLIFVPKSEIEVF